MKVQTNEMKANTFFINNWSSTEKTNRSSIGLGLSCVQQQQQQHRGSPSQSLDQSVCQLALYWPIGSTMEANTFGNSICQSPDDSSKKEGQLVVSYKGHIILYGVREGNDPSILVSTKNAYFPGKCFREGFCEESERSLRNHCVWIHNWEARLDSSVGPLLPPYWRNSQSSLSCNSLQCLSLSTNCLLELAWERCYSRHSARHSRLCYYMKKLWRNSS